MQDGRKWSRDWADFDWTQVKKRFEEMEGKKDGEKAVFDVGISRDEFLEYLDWLSQNDMEGFYKAVLGIQLAEMGFDEDQAETLVAHPDMLIKAMESIIKE